MSGSDQEPGDDGQTSGQQKRTRKRILRAVFAADIAGFSSKMSLNETSAVTSLSEIRSIGLQELKTYNGWLFGMPGDGLFALFESAVGAVQCGLEIQRVLSGRPHLSDMPMRVGIHLGEVLIDEGLPFGEALNIAARLEALCEPGELLVSATVMDAVSARVSATFETAVSLSSKTFRAGYKPSLSSNHRREHRQTLEISLVQVWIRRPGLTVKRCAKFWTIRQSCRL